MAAEIESAWRGIPLAIRFAVATLFGLLAGAGALWVKEQLFPGRMKRLEADLRGVTVGQCSGDVVASEPGSFVLEIIYQDQGPVRVEVYEHSLRVLSSDDTLERLIAASINENRDGTYHASRVLIVRDLLSSRIIRLRGFSCAKLAMYSTSFLSDVDELPACGRDLRTFRCE